MKIAVVGLWHLGCVTAACLASAGYNTIGLDEDQNAIEQLNQGKAPLFEPGLDELIQANLNRRLLSFSTDFKKVQDTQIVWIAYDTPVDENDQADVAYVLKRVESLFPSLAEGTQLIISSQLPVGSCQYLAEKYKKTLPEGNLRLAYLPENLRLGRAIEVFTKPDRIIAGIQREADKGPLASLLYPFTNNIVWMSVASAEMTKHAINAFLATSVVFINELAVLCEKVGADAREVEQGLKSESRIGPKAYLRAGNAFSGGTLARDVTFLAKMSQETHPPLQLFKAVRQSNESHKSWITSTIRKALGELRYKRIAVWGLTYKPGTDTLRRSLSIELCHWLQAQGAQIVAFDPAVKTLPGELAAFISLQGTALDAAQGSDALILATEWNGFKEIGINDLKKVVRQLVVIDPGRFLEATLANDSLMHYYSIGKGPSQ